MAGTFPLLAASDRGKARQRAVAYTGRATARASSSAIHTGGPISSSTIIDRISGLLKRTVPFDRLGPGERRCCLGRC
jgi:hypothetical protein